MDVRVERWTWRSVASALLVHLCLIAPHVHAQPRFEGDGRMVTEGRTSPRPVLFQAPDFALPTLSGETVRLTDLRGKVVLLNFWATWCVPCRKEMPTIEALYQRYKDRGLEVLGMNLDKGSSPDVEAFVKEVGVTFHIVLDPAWATMRAYKVRGLPTTFLIDRAGDVRVQDIGERDWMAEAIQRTVEELLQAPTAAEQR